MDTTKKTLSVDIDTAALVDKANKAKSAISDLTNQLKALKTAGTNSGPVFTTLSNQLKATTADFTASTKALQDYTNALIQKTQAEQADAKVMTDNKAAQSGGDSDDPANHGQPVLAPVQQQVTPPALTNPATLPTANILSAKEQKDADNQKKKMMPGKKEDRNSLKI